MAFRAPRSLVGTGSFRQFRVFYPRALDRRGGLGRWQTGGIRSKLLARVRRGIEGAAGFREPAVRQNRHRRLCAGLRERAIRKRCPLRWDRPPHCSFHHRFAGPRA